MKKFISCLLSIFILGITILIPGVQAQAANKNTLVFRTQYIDGYSQTSYSKAENYVINKFTKNNSYNDWYCEYKNDTNNFIKKYNISSTNKKILTYNYYSYHAMMVDNLVIDVREDYEAGKINKDTYIKSMKLLNSYFRYNIESGAAGTLKACPQKGYDEFETMLYYGRNYTNLCLQNTNAKTDLLAYANKNMKPTPSTMEEDVEGVLYIKDTIKSKYTK